MTPGVVSDMYNASKSNSRTATSLTRETVPAASPKSSDLLNLTELAAAELEQLDCGSGSIANSAHGGGGGGGGDHQALEHFPAACRALLLDLDGNTRCLDCNKQHPEWAAVSYGAMVCLNCAGAHRSLGVTVSTVRSVTMDHWKREEVVKMLEGGNRQLSTFFQRHALSRECVEFQSPKLNRDNVSSMRYKTKAASFYRQQLDHHVQALLSKGPYVGRKHRTKRRPLGTQASNLE